MWFIIGSVNPARILTLSGSLTGYKRRCLRRHFSKCTFFEVHFRSSDHHRSEHRPCHAETVPFIEKIRKEYYAAVVDGPAAVSEQNFLRYGVSTTPTLALLDRRGIVRLYHPGGMTYQELRSAIQGVLQTP